VTNLATAESLFFSALAAQEKQDFVTAERLYREALSVAPDRPSIVNNLAAVLFQLKRFEDSRSLCERQLELRPDDATLRVLLGNVFAGLRDFTPALQCYDSVLRSAPDHLDALINNAHVLESMGRPLDALTYLNRALELQPHHVDALNNRGNVLTDLNRFDEALRDYQQAQQAAPASARAYWNEAVCRLFLGEFERGWALYNHGWSIGQRGIGKPAFTQPPGLARNLRAPCWSGANRVSVIRFFSAACLMIYVIARTALSLPLSGAWFRCFADRSRISGYLISKNPSLSTVLTVRLLSATLADCCGTTGTRSRIPAINSSMRIGNKWRQYAPNWVAIRR